MGKLRSNNESRINEVLSLIDALNDSLHNTLQRLEKTISVLSEFDFNDVSDLLTHYNDIISDIKKLMQHNSVAASRLEKFRKEIMCTSDIIRLEGEAKIADTDAFKALIDSLEIIDDDCQDIVDAAKEHSKQVATSLSETGMKGECSEDDAQARRKKLRQVLLSGSTVSVAYSRGSSEEYSNTSSHSCMRERKDTISGDDSRGHLEASSFSSESIRVPEGKLAGGYGMCRICGTIFHQETNYCPCCGTKAVIEKPQVQLDKVFFSAVAPKSIVKGEYSMIDIFMYEEDFRSVVEEAIANAENDVKETKSGMMRAGKESNIKVVLSSPDLTIEDNTEEQVWHGEHLDFSFAVELPEDFQKKQILFVATVYVNDVIATRLKFIAKCMASKEQKMEVIREDVLSAFVSYASQDRNRVAMIIQGMKKARPDMDIFFDVESLRSGDDWEKALWHEIDKRDVLFLCWSKSARDSQWVDAEWRYALKQKGPDCIEPVPIDPPGVCPPPEELSKKHFNDKLLYIINSDYLFGSRSLSLEMDDDTAWQLKTRLESLF